MNVRCVMCSVKGIPNVKIVFKCPVSNQRPLSIESTGKRRINKVRR